MICMHIEIPRMHAFVKGISSVSKCSARGMRKRHENRNVSLTNANPQRPPVSNWYFQASLVEMIKQTA